MRVLLRNLKREHFIGLLFVLALHGAGLYALWSCRIIPAPVEAFIMVSSLIEPPARPPLLQPEPRKPLSPRPDEPRKPQQIVAETPVVQPEEPVALPPPVIEALPQPLQPVMLSGNLAVGCPQRSPPEYPALSMRMNEQGKVVLRVELGEDGRIVTAQVATSSGSRRLDDAALSAVRTWRCKPPMRDGVAVRAVALQPFNFILEGR